jgi:hypothetical protein
MLNYAGMGMQMEKVVPEPGSPHAVDVFAVDEAGVGRCKRPDEE